MGGQGSGRPLGTQPGSRAGLLLIEWAKARQPKALDKLADKIGVNTRTLTRWIAGREPPVSGAVKINQITRVPITAWLESID